MTQFLQCEMALWATSVPHVRYGYSNIGINRIPIYRYSHFFCFIRANLIVLITAHISRYCISSCDTDVNSLNVLLWGSCNESHHSTSSRKEMNFTFIESYELVYDSPIVALWRAQAKVVILFPFKDSNSPNSFAYQIPLFSHKISDFDLRAYFYVKILGH